MPTLVRFQFSGRSKSREQAREEESGSKLPHSKASHAPTLRGISAFWGRGHPMSSITDGAYYPHH